MDEVKDSGYSSFVTNTATGTSSRIHGFRRRTFRMCLYVVTVVILLLAKAIFDLRELHYHQRLKSLTKKRALPTTVVERSFTLEDAFRISHEVENVKEMLNMTSSEVTTDQSFNESAAVQQLLTKSQTTNGTGVTVQQVANKSDAVTLVQARDSTYKTHATTDQIVIESNVVPLSPAKLETGVSTAADKAEVSPLIQGNKTMNEAAVTTDQVSNKFELLPAPAKNETVNESIVDADLAEQQATNTGSHRARYPVVDILSIGSTSRIDYLQGQRSSWGSHPSIRWFVNATEQDDADPYCFRNTTEDDIKTLIKYCRNLHSTPFLSQYKYFPSRWVLKKANPAGWWCAQVRPGSGLGKLGRLYRQKRQEASDEKDHLPDFVLVVDDDTMYQMELFLTAMEGVDPLAPRVWAGCLTVLRETPPHRFTPFGGAGTIWSRGALQRLFQPIWCNDTKTSFQQQVCARVKENLIRERVLWVDGMSVSDLIECAFNHYPNCFFSDWLLGHFVNYYYLSEVWSEDYGFRNVSESRFHLYYDAFQFFHDPLSPNVSNTGSTCETTTDPQTAAGHCSSTSPVCHYVSPETMIKVSSEWLPTKSSNGKDEAGVGR